MRKRKDQRELGIISEPVVLTCEMVQCVHLRPSRQSAPSHTARRPAASQLVCSILWEWSDKATFAGLPTFWPTTFHLLASYSLIAASKAALCFYFVSIRTPRYTSVTWTHLVFSKLGVVHILQRLWSANGSTE
jgi:hypothetical protein